MIHLLSRSYINYTQFIQFFIQPSISHLFFHSIIYFWRMFHNKGQQTIQSEDQPQSTTWFPMACQPTMVSTFSNGWEKNQKNISWHVKIKWPSNCIPGHSFLISKRRRLVHNIILLSFLDSCFREHEGSKCRWEMAHGRSRVCCTV